MALGAQRRNVIANVIRQGGLLVAFGCAIGLGLCVPATSALSQLLFETTPLDPAIFAGAVLLLALIGVLACLLPGIRASQLDPRAALNTE
jgi:ABC-type antimicrobial peptide transport system permease subunit